MQVYSIVFTDYTSNGESRETKNNIIHAFVLLISVL